MYEYLCFFFWLDMVGCFNVSGKTLAVQSRNFASHWQNVDDGCVFFLIPSNEFGPAFTWTL